jgi:WD40 repeat protein
MQVFADHKTVIYSLAFSPDGTALATGAKDGSVWLRTIDGRVDSLVERGPKELAVNAVNFLQNDRTVIVGGATGWNGYKLDDEGQSHKFGPQAFPQITSLAPLNERTVAIGTGDRARATSGTLELWDILANRKLLPYFHEPNGVRAISVCSAKKLVAWATGHRKVCLWDITTPKPIALPQSGNCPSIALNATGSALAVAVDWTAKIYDLPSKRERCALRGHKGQVTAVAFSPDGKTLATGSWDFTVRLWDVATGKELANYNWDIGRIYCLAYAPDGLRIAAGGDLGRVVVWDTE